MKLRTALSRGLGTFNTATSRTNRLSNVSCRNRKKIGNNGCAINQTRTTPTTSKFVCLVPATAALLGCHRMGLCYHQAHCEYRPSRNSRLMEEVNRDTTKEAEFPWSEFLKLLLPDIWYLLGAVVVSTVNVAIMYNVLLIVKDVQKVGNVNSYNYIDA